MIKTVFCTTQFGAYHYWEDAPNSVAFLRHPHRHMFHVKYTAYVEGSDREVEFISMKAMLDSFLRSRYEENNFGHSCEQLAEQIDSEMQRRGYKTCSVAVSEDGENGATIVIPLEDHGVSLPTP